MPVAFEVGQPVDRMRGFRRLRLRPSRCVARSACRVCGQPVAHAPRRHADAICPCRAPSPRPDAEPFETRPGSACHIAARVTVPQEPPVAASSAERETGPAVLHIRCRAASDVSPARSLRAPEPFGHFAGFGDQPRERLGRQSIPVKIGRTPANKTRTDLHGSRELARCDPVFQRPDRAAHDFRCIRFRE